MKTKLLIASSRLPITIAKRKPARELLIGQASELTIEQCGENIVYGNEKGHGVLRTLEELEELEEHGESLERQRENNWRTTSGRPQPNQTTAEILELTYGQPCYNSRKHIWIHIREQIFFDVYRRDIKQLQRYQYSKVIRFGNSAARGRTHSLLECDQRTWTDRTLYRQLYGLDAD